MHWLCIHDDYIIMLIMTLMDKFEKRGHYLEERGIGKRHILIYIDSNRQNQ